MSVAQQIGDQRPASPTGPASDTGKAPVPTLGALLSVTRTERQAGGRAGRAAAKIARRNMNIIMGKARGRIKMKLFSFPTAGR